MIFFLGKESCWNTQVLPSLSSSLDLSCDSIIYVHLYPFLLYIWYIDYKFLLLWRQIWIYDIVWTPSFEKRWLEVIWVTSRPKHLRANSNSPGLSSLYLGHITEGWQFIIKVTWISELQHVRECLWSFMWFHFRIFC